MQTFKNFKIRINFYKTKHFSTDNLLTFVAAWSKNKNSYWWKWKNSKWRQYIYDGMARRQKSHDWQVYYEIKVINILIELLVKTNKWLNTVIDWFKFKDNYRVLTFFDN